MTLPAKTPGSDEDQDAKSPEGESLNEKFDRVARQVKAQGVPAGEELAADELSASTGLKWEEAESTVSDKLLAAKLHEAIGRHRGIGNEVQRKIVGNIYDDRNEEFREAAKEILEDHKRGNAETLRKCDEAFDAYNREFRREMQALIDEAGRKQKDFLRPLGEPSKYASPDLFSDGARSVVSNIEAALSTPGKPKGTMGYGGIKTNIGMSTASSQNTEFQGAKGLGREGGPAGQPGESGSIVVVGSDGPLGVAISSTLGGSRPVVGITAEEGQNLLARESVRQTLRSANTLILAPDAANGGAKGGGGMFGAVFGSGSAPSQGLTGAQAEAIINTCGPALRHVVCISGVGAGKEAEFSFDFQSTKELERQRGLEAAVKGKAKRLGVEHTIIRAGKLVDQAQGKPAVEVSPTDSIKGETTRETLAEAVMYSTVFPAARNATCSVVNVAGKRTPSEEDWRDQFLKLQGPELMRLRVSDLLGKTKIQRSEFARVGLFLREWSTFFTKPGHGLTTPVEVKADETMVEILFRPTTKQYVSSKEEKQMAKEADDRGAKPSSTPPRTPQYKQKKEGGLIFVLEETPYPRVRVMRCNMDQDTVLKEMSEKTILDRFRKDIDVLKSQQ